MAAKKRNVTKLPTDKRERFVALIKKRMPRAIGAIESVSKTASKANTFNANDAAAIVTALTLAVAALETAFNDAIAGGTVTTGPTFELPSITGETGGENE